MGSSQPLLEFRKISKVYNDGSPVTALQETNLTIYRGEYVGIVGPSGSGKSTMLNVLGLLDNPTNGQYWVDGIETTTAPDQITLGIRGRRFGFVFQSFHLLSGRSALENVELGTLYTEPDRRVRRKQAASALRRFGLGHRLHADPRTLSGGERQRVAIARALSGSPDVVFCDEPTGNLDSQNTSNVTNILQQLNDEGLTIVVVTHDKDLAAECGRQVTVRDGIVSESAT